MTESTDSPIELVGLGGSLAEHSTSRTALREVLAAAEDAGAQTTLFDIRKLDLPMYRPGAEVPDAVEEMLDAVECAHGMVWSSPLYHGSISGSFKNAIDWFQVLARRDVPYLDGKVVGLVATAGGVQGLQAVNTMEYIVRALRAYAVPLVIPVSRTHEAFDDEAALDDEDVRDQLHDLGEEVLSAARQLARTGDCDYSR
ncbi:MAG: NADPH-dependent FMN reductase [Bradymonadaceae bacterium]